MKVGLGVELRGIEPLAESDVTSDKSVTYRLSCGCMSTPTSTLGSNTSSNSEIQKKDAVRIVNLDTKRPSPEPTSDPNLQALINSWHRLPEAIRAGIMAMVRDIVARDERDND